jgi:hypothetical protein
MEDSKMVMETIGIKTWLARVFPVMTPSAKEKALAERLAEADAKIEANNIKLRNAIIRFTSMGRVSEVLLNASYPRSDEVAYEMLVGYRNILMEEYHITEYDLISVEETIRILKVGELF